MTNLRFDNRFVRELPGDPEAGSRRRQVHGALHSLVSPTPVAEPRLLALSREVARLLDLDECFVQTARFAQVFGGNALLHGMQTYAANYGGHQFGNWAGQLGDGRAIALGETINTRGERWELQLKGAGPTPYSRTADGRAVLRSSVREFLCSEAMHHLGVPTTRALSLVATGDSVVRDMFYDGHPQPEPGAVVCRVAPSFIRFGNFELPASRGDDALLRRLVEFTIARDFPEITSAGAERLGDWFGQVCERTALMVAHWTRVGFVHGVMNTDNMSILGLTIDYGPYGWIDNYDPEWTPNTTDREHRRYRFGQQAQVAFWNLSRLAGALLSVFEGEEALQEGLQRFARSHAEHDRQFTAAKLGLREIHVGDQELVQALKALLAEGEIDMTLFFRGLANLDPTRPDTLTPLQPAFYDAGRLQLVEPMLVDWLQRYATRVAAEAWPTGQRKAAMDAVNPLYVLRNYLAQQVIDQAEQGDSAGISRLLDVLRRPYEAQAGCEDFSARRPDWARNRAGCSMLSCSS